MANYPNKPWTDGQTFEIVPGETHQYDATQGVWTHVTKATLDSDFQVDKTALESSINTNTSDISGLDTRLNTAEGDITTLQSQVSALDAMSDSETARIQQNISDINAAFAMLDSDGINLQALRTDLDAEITATNNDVTAITNRLDSDETVLQTISVRMPVVSDSAPVGASGMLWINTTDGKLYYWNDSDAFISIVTT